MSGVILRALRQTRPFRSLEEEIIVGVQMAAHRLVAPWARILDDRADLTPTQYNLLRILRGAGRDGRTCSEIAERLITRDPDVTRLTERLVRRGLARRDVDRVDRRVARIRITQEGSALLRRLDPVIAELPRRLLRGMDTKQQRALLAGLEMLIAGAPQWTSPQEKGADHAEA